MVCERCGQESELQVCPECIEYQTELDELNKWQIQNEWWEEEVLNTEEVYE